MKTRLDVALVERGLMQSRERAKAVIMSGIVYVNNQKADKAWQDVSETDQIEIRGETLRYVSRGGLKLEKAMEACKVEVLSDGSAATAAEYTDALLELL